MSLKRCRAKGLKALSRLIGGKANERGVTLVEFALLAFPFFLLVFGILEVGFLFWSAYDLDNATEDAARQIRTGQIQAGTHSVDDFKALVCSRVTILSQCTTKLQVDVRSFNDYSDIQSNQPAPLDGDGELQTSFSWDTGGPGSIVLVSTFYQWPFFTGLTNFALSNMADGDRLLRSSAAFRNEPWPAPSGSGG